MSTEPTTEKGRRTRARIVDAAAELFYERGVSATGLGDVIAASGTGKGQLYHFFTDKGDLVSAVIRHQVEGTLAPQRELGVHRLDDLQEWARQAVLQHEQSPVMRCPLGSLVVELSDRDADAASALEAGFAQWRELMSGWIAELQRRGEARTDLPADDLTDSLLAAYQGGLVLARSRGDLRPLETALALAIEGIGSSRFAGER